MSVDLHKTCELDVEKTDEIGRSGVKCIEMTIIALVLGTLRGTEVTALCALGHLTCCRFCTSFSLAKYGRLRVRGECHVSLARYGALSLCRMDAHVWRTDTIYC